MSTENSAPAWREGYVAAGDVRFFVRALGHGDDLAVLLHGWPEHGGSFGAVAPRLVEAGYRVACPDLKGFGRTRGGGRYDPEALADEIAQLIRALHARRAVLLGHDWGGAIALATAFRHPGLVRALVVASSPYREMDLRAAWHVPLHNLPVLPEVGYRLGARHIVRTAVRHAAVVQHPFTDEVLDDYAAGIAADPAGWLAYYRTLPRAALRQSAARRLRRALPLVRPRPAPTLRVPAAVLWGGRDPVTPPRLAPQVADDLGATATVLAAVGHFVHEEAPEATARALLELAGPGEGGRLDLAEEPSTGAEESPPSEAGGAGSEGR